VVTVHRGGPTAPRTTPRHGPLLVVSAFAPELAPLRRELRRGEWRPLIAARQLICQPVGIGLVAAAAGTARAIAAWSPRQVIFVGTAGSYAPAPAVGSVGIAQRILLTSTAALRGAGYLPGPMRTRLASSGPLTRQLLAQAPSLEVCRVDVANPLAISRTRTLARMVARATGASAENLEVFAVASAAHLHRIPFAAVLGISNRVGPAAHEEWLKHQSEATRAACAVVASYLRATLRVET
jgi:nucleoside phosphorylase